MAVIDNDGFIVSLLYIWLLQKKIKINTKFIIIQLTTSEY